MPSVQIKDLPEETHRVLRLRAAAANQSLKEYLRARLIAEAAQPTLDEVLDRAGCRTGGLVSIEQAASALRGNMLVVDASGPVCTARAAPPR